MTLKEYRLKNNLQQDEIAKKLNVSVAAISKWEHGLYSDKIAKAISLDTTLSDIIEIIQPNSLQNLQKENKELKVEIIRLKYLLDKKESNKAKNKLERIKKILND